MCSSSRTCLRAYFIPFLTVMFRRRALEAVPAGGSPTSGSTGSSTSACARQGKIGFLDEDLAAYRVHAGGNWSSRDRVFQLEEDLRSTGAWPGSCPAGAD